MWDAFAFFVTCIYFQKVNILILDLEAFFCLLFDMCLIDMSDCAILLIYIPINLSTVDSYGVYANRSCFKVCGCLCVCV